jgi:tetratricopeptide (TPR) repeat protein
MKAKNCANAKSLTSTEAQASDKSHVLEALGKASSEIRKKLGESHASVQNFDKPLQEVTTPSLEALQSFTRADTLRARGKEVESIPLYKHAVELDPNFAMAYARLGLMFEELGELDASREYTKKAFLLADRVSRKEKFYILSWYYDNVNGEADKAIETDQLWAQTYARDWYPHNHLAYFYRQTGQFDNSIREAKEALRLETNYVMPYSNLAFAYMDLNRFDEAKAMIAQEISRGMEPEYLHWILFEIAFIQKDEAGMKKEVEWARGRPEESSMRNLEAIATVATGRVRKARELTQQAVGLAQSHGLNEEAAGYLVGEANFEVALGNEAEARQEAKKALTISKGVGVETGAAATLARTNELAQAKTIAENLKKQFPLSTFRNTVDIPIILALAEIRRGNPTHAVELLQTSLPYELGESAGLTPAYVRGEAYLQMHEGSKAGNEFQKILDHRGIDPFDFALANLGLARAYVLQKDTAKARIKYQDFFALWKDADPDIPVLKKAKAEFAKLGS